MPIQIGAEIRHMEDKEFGETVYEVMRHVFDVHRELGRLFNERIYQRELAFRISGAEREVPVEVRIEDFCKVYYLDLLVRGGAVFELKAVETLTDRHDRQLLHYLFLTGLPHGKLVNLRPESVDHRFVNNALTHRDRTDFVVADDGWDEAIVPRLTERTIAMLRDWGTGLSLELYREATAHFCRQPPDAEVGIETRIADRSLGLQRMRMAASGFAFEITAFPPDRRRIYETQLRHLLAHTPLQGIQWINVPRSDVMYKTITKSK